LRSGEFGTDDAPVVIKADGLAAGKGVVVARTRAEAESAIENLMEVRGIAGDAGQRVVIEEALEGREVSLLLWTNGSDYILMPAARDHKRIGEGDTGPNTGGMGAITAPEVLDENLNAAIVRDIVEPTLDGARRDELGFSGVLFIGLMLTAAGARVLEYNVRFGDPEAQAILVRLQSSLVDVFEAVAYRRLGQTRVKWSDDASACVVLAARGYPERPETGARIEGLDVAGRETPAVKIFHAGTERANADDLIVSGGRVLGVTAAAATLDLALQHCYTTIDHVRWGGMQYRRDIGRFTESSRL
jgi:phosphoribosylamine--glycine ligase